jgi:uncharacterized protein (TIGR02284 family)
MTETVTNRAVEQLNSLLRGEISAAETYRLAIEKVGNERASEKSSLREISREHGEHAQKLRAEIRRLGGEAEDSSGAWGAWARSVEAVSTLFGDTSALKALKEGEEHGLKDYREALDDLDPSARGLVGDTLIPAQRRHIDIIDAMIERP